MRDKWIGSDGIRLASDQEWVKLNMRTFLGNLGLPGGGGVPQDHNGM